MANRFVALVTGALLCGSLAHAAPPKKKTPAAQTKPAAPAQPAAEAPSMQLAPLDLSEPPPAPAPKPVEAPAPVKTIEAVSPTAEPTDAGVEAAAKPAATDDGKMGISIGAKVALLVPAGRTTDVKANLGNAGQEIGDASHSATVAFGLAVSYSPSFMERALSLRGEAGFYPLSGTGSRDYPNDPDFGSMTYSYKANAIPLLLGLGYRLPLGLPVELAPTAGFAAVYSTFSSSWTRDAVTTETAPVSGWALGFYLGGEAAYALGPGMLTAELRYMNARTDLRLRDVKEYGGAFNRELGDVEGTNVLVGYRLSL